MTEARRRWAGRLRRLARFAGDCLSTGGASMMWFTPPAPIDLPVDGRPESGDVDPRELDA